MSTKPTEVVTCPVCSTEMPVVVLFANAETQAAFSRLASVSMPLGTRVLQYLTLFAPPKTRLTIAKQVKLILQLLPDLERGAITHKGREWQAPRDAWARAIDQMLEARAAGRLDLPMTGHTYLYAIMAGLSDKHEAQAEMQEERERAHRAPRQDTVQASDLTLPIGEALDVMYGGKDPALAKIDADAKKAAPMPVDVRAHLASLRGKSGGGRP